MRNIYFQQITYEALDFVINTIQERFEQANYQAYVTLQNLFRKAAQDFSKERRPVTERYDTDIVLERLKLHVKKVTEIYARGSPC